MECLPECPSQTTGTWRTLLGHLRPCSDMANGAILLNLVHPSWIAKPATGSHHGIPPSARRDAAVHEIAARVQVQWDDKKNTCTNIDTQCVWPETIWSHVE